MVIFPKILLEAPAIAWFQPKHNVSRYLIFSKPPKHMMIPIWSKSQFSTDLLKLFGAPPSEKRVLFIENIPAATWSCVVIFCPFGTFENHSTILLRHQQGGNLILWSPSHHFFWFNPMSWSSMTTGRLDLGLHPWLGKPFMGSWSLSTGLVPFKSTGTACDQLNNTSICIMFMNSFRIINNMLFASMYHE